VERGRTPTKIENSVTVSGTSVFTWVVYESPTATGTFTKVFEKTTSSTASAAFVSSGTVSVPLSAGKFYLIGVAVQGFFTGYFNPSTAKPFTSFGQFMGGWVQSTSAPAATISVSSSSSTSNSYQRISTAH
jgi:hypothetical protein